MNIERSIIRFPTVHRTAFADSLSLWVTHKKEWSIHFLINNFVQYVFRNLSVHLFLLFVALRTSTSFKIHHGRLLSKDTFSEGSNRAGFSAFVIPCPTFIFQVKWTWIQKNRKSSEHYLMLQVHLVVLVSELLSAAAVQIVSRSDHLYVFFQERTLSLSPS